MWPAWWRSSKRRWSADHLVADIKKGEKDSSGSVIDQVYAKYPPHYAVYRTPDRVCIEYADDPSEEQQQRIAICELNPLLGKINCLIDNWRSSENPSRKRAARHTDRRIADALVMACEGDLPAAEATLIDVKNDLLNQRVSWARFLYLAIASVTAIVGIVVIAPIAHIKIANPNSPFVPIEMLLLAAGAGTIGAFFSISIGIRKRTVLPDLYMLNNGADAALRILIGVIAAAVLVSLLQTKLVTFGLGSDSISLDYGSPNPHAHPWWLLVLVVGFVGGFLERLVPDLLEKTALAKSDVTGADSIAAQSEASKTNHTNGNSRNGRQSSGAKVGQV